MPHGELTDVELAERIQKYECEDSLKTLIQRHTPIVYHIHQKYSHKMQNSGVVSNGGFDDKDYLIYTSAKAYKPDKNTKYSTFLANQVRYFCLNSMKEKKELAFDDGCLNEMIDKKGGTENNFYLNLSYVNSILVQLKDKRVKKILEMRYLGDTKMNWADIGKKLGLSPTMVINLHNRGCTFLKNKLTSKDTYDKV